MSHATAESLVDVALGFSPDPAARAHVARCTSCTELVERLSTTGSRVRASRPVRWQHPPLTVWHAISEAVGPSAAYVPSASPQLHAPAVLSAVPPLAATEMPVVPDTPEALVGAQTLPPAVVEPAAEMPVTYPVDAPVLEVPAEPVYPAPAPVVEAWPPPVAAAPAPVVEAWPSPVAAAPAPVVEAPAYPAPAPVAEFPAPLYDIPQVPESLSYPPADTDEPAYETRASRAAAREAARRKNKWF